MRAVRLHLDSERKTRCDFLRFSRLLFAAPPSARTCVRVRTVSAGWSAPPRRPKASRRSKPGKDGWATTVATVGLKGAGPAQRRPQLLATAATQKTGGPWSTRAWLSATAAGGRAAGMVGDFSFPERTVIVFRLILCFSMVAFLGLVGVALAGASPEPAAAVAGCHGAPASCHGRLTVAQRIAARQTVRQDARAAKRAAASCHGPQ